MSNIKKQSSYTKTVPYPKFWNKKLMAMIATIRNILFYIWSSAKGPYTILCILLFSIFIAPPLINENLISIVTMEIVFLLMLVAGVFAVQTTFTIRILTVFIALVALVIRILYRFDYHRDFEILDNIISCTTLSIFTFLMVQQFLIRNSNLRYRIAAAVSIYLLFGLLWSRLYEIVYLIDPDSFNITSHKTNFTLLYFSFVTLITLGYGDVLPVSLIARNLAILEGVSGQLYMVIMISTLVSEFSASFAKKN